MRWLKRLPSTNLAVFAGVMMAVALEVYVIMAGVVEGTTGSDVLIGTEYLEVIRTFVVLVLGIATAQFSVKRITHKEGVGEPEPE